MFFVMIRYSAYPVKEQLSGRHRQKTLDWMIQKENGKTYGYLEQKAKSINESTEPASGRTSKQVKLL